MYTFLILSLVITLVLKCFSSEPHSPVFGIYQHPGTLYHFKVIVFYILLSFRKFLHILWKSDAGYGVKSRVSAESMDCMQTLSQHPKAIDAVYFNLANEEGWHLITGTAHRPHGVVNGFLYMKVPNVGLLMSPKLPDTMMFRNELERKDKYGAEGLVIAPFQPMRTWELQYKGKMKSSTDESKLFDVEINAVWSSEYRYFDYDTDMDPLCISRAMALETWSREYFQNVRSSHQTHYEQFGKLHGKVTVNGKQYTIKMDGVRDHSYGEKREWKNFHRYVLHYITLENGMKISAGIICAPLAFSRLEIGYVYQESGEPIPLNGCNLKLYQHGEGGTPPTHYGFSFEAGGMWYHVQVEIFERSEFYIGWEWETRVVECLGNFKVNGVKGWGAAEWQYRHMGGRPDEVASSDPEWAKSIEKA
ncbi:uncharacterized protein LOC126184833 [Schistocerca cancellata]|uniref:uncharacterized protein LOC126184833 n=1 Tax=Schistocerca cancellata TaxID=274614 RepID=UPI002118DC0C|nr:uncharacterized protein LOC126184833 [Schistocerca cancellata]